MEFAEAEASVRSLAKRMADAEANLEKATRTVAGLRKIIAGYVEMYPDLLQIVVDTVGSYAFEEGEEERPRGAEAVRIILQEAPGKWFRASELVGILRERGWLPESDNPANAVRAALERLVVSEDSDVFRGKYKSGAVVYTYDPDRDRAKNPSAGFGYDEEPF